MGRWRAAWFDVFDAFCGGRITLEQLNAISARLVGMQPNEESLAVLRSSLAAAIEEHANTTKAVEAGAGTQAPREPASGPASLESA